MIGIMTRCAPAHPINVRLLLGRPTLGHYQRRDLRDLRRVVLAVLTCAAFAVPGASAQTQPGLAAPIGPDRNNPAPLREPRVIPGLGPGDGVGPADLLNALRPTVAPPPVRSAVPDVSPRAPTQPVAPSRPASGITIPQPTGKIVEPVATSRIREPEPISRTILPEVPGQPRVVAPSGPALSVVPVPRTPSMAAPAPVQPAARTQPAGRGLTEPVPVTARGAPPLPFVLSTDPRPTYGPDTFIATARAADRYLAIADRGGWPTLDADTNLAEGSSGSKVLALKQILNVVGDLPDGEVLNPRFDAATTLAVKAFQVRHGLAQTGVVSGRTLSELNVPARTRHAQLAGSAQRLSQAGFAFGPRYLVVNIPAATLEAVDNGQVVRRYAAIVGRPDRPSPVLETRATAVNLNPFWTVPASIVQADIAPAMQRDPNYLARARISVYDARGAQVDPASIDWRGGKLSALTLRQEPGAANALGRIRIDMPNSQSVYLHDTPNQRLFARDDRFHSSGCVRVADIPDLATWLLAETQGADKRTIDKQSLMRAIQEGERRDLKIAKPVPMAWIYLTGYAERGGTVHFRPDIYGLDQPKAQNAAR